MVTVVAALIEFEGKLLVCQRKRGSRFELLWEFPGGKVEPGETLPEALARELREELGVVAPVGPEVYRTVFQYRELPQATELVFLAAIARPEDIRNLEFERIEWRAPQDLGDLDFLPADRDLVRQLRAGTLRVPPPWTASTAAPTAALPPNLREGI